MSAGARRSPAYRAPLDDDLDPADRLTLVELVDRLLDRGVVLSGDVTISLAGVDLIYVGLRALVSSIDAAEREGVPLP